MRVVVFGATGGTGRAVVSRALLAGHDVTAFSRRSSEVMPHHVRLKVMRGDVFEPDTVEAAVTGEDSVVSALGPGRSRAATQVYSAGMASIVTAMKAAGVRRLLCVSTSGLAGPGLGLFRDAVGKVLHAVLAGPYADMARMEEEVRWSGLDWTIVRAARLTNRSPTRRYRTGVNRPLSGAWSISRADLADYLIRHLSDPASFSAVVEIAQ
jgi:putative NADH-flavin reductase